MKNPKELEDPEEIAKTKDAMRKFAKAERAMKKEARGSRSSGCTMSFIKFALFWAAIGAVVYGVYLWHPWKHTSENVEETAMSECDGGRGYRTNTTLEILGVAVRTTTSVICVGDD